jgi:hypothetical protein
VSTARHGRCGRSAINGEATTPAAGQDHVRGDEKGSRSVTTRGRTALATRARDSPECGHDEHMNAVTAHSRPSGQKRVVHEF